MPIEERDDKRIKTLFASVYIPAIEQQDCEFRATAECQIQGANLRMPGNTVESKDCGLLTP